MNTTLGAGSAKVTPISRGRVLREFGAISSGRDTEPCTVPMTAQKTPSEPPWGLLLLGALTAAWMALGLIVWALLQAASVVFH